MATGAAVASAAVGAGSLAQGKKAGDKAEDANASALGSAEEMNKYLRQLGDQGVDMAQGMMDDWESTFGGIQDNLSEYYNNLDPDKFSTANKSAYKQSMDKQMKQFDESMAATGLQSAGMKQQAMQESAFQTAEANAGFDIMAPEQVNQMKQGFVNSGEGQRNSANNAMQNAQGRQGSYAQSGMTNLQNTQTNQANQYSNSQTGYMGMAGDAFGSAIGLGIEGYNGGGSKPKLASGASATGYGANQSAISGPRRPDGNL